ncbi:MAG: PHP domain-containing protein [Methylococcales bacterium]
MLMTESAAFNSTTAQKRYRGFAHCHSKYSYDGKYSYAELRELFLKKGLDFVCITEHIEYLDQSKIDALIDDCRANSDQQFLFIPGLEMDEFVIYFIGIDHVNIDFSSSKAVFNSLLSVARLCVFSHPIKAKYQYPMWLMNVCDGVEIWNTKHDGIHYPRRQSLNLLKQVCNSRAQAVALVGMDFHSQSHLSPANIELLNYGELNEDFVLDEIKHGRFRICKDQQYIDSISAMHREFLWLRIAFMDMAHALHLALSSRGIVVPKSLKRGFRKLMEGK